jgi:urease accessory protein
MAAAIATVATSMTMGTVTATATTIIIMIEPLALSRLLQLASPMLPVGAYSYSGGLEAAIESGIVHGADSTRVWVEDVLALYLARFELPILSRLHQCWAGGGDGADDWNARFRAGRDTSEGRAETLQMGSSLVLLLRDLGEFPAEGLARLKEMAPVTFPLAYAFATAHWGIPVEAALHAYAWSWAENQVGVAMKAVPIGQVAGQRILMAVSSDIPAIVAGVIDYPDSAISNFAPGLTLASCRHETQYSRLFRS